MIVSLLFGFAVVSCVGNGLVYLQRGRPVSLIAALISLAVAVSAAAFM